MIRIISVGSKNEPWIQEGIGHYQKRLKPPFDIEWILLNSKAKDSARARQIDSQAILSLIAKSEFVILLDELGEQMTSTQLAGYLSDKFVNSFRVVFVIGGAYGVDSLMKQRANKILSVSSFVLPHQLVRLLLTEQIYRALEISRNNPYHHD